MNGKNGRNGIARSRDVSAAYAAGLMKNNPFNLIDRVQIVFLSLSFRLFRPLIRRYYRVRKLYDTRVYNESHIFYFRNGKRLTDKCRGVVEKSGYPETSLDFEKLVDKLRAGYSFSRFGDGEYSMIMSGENRTVYFDKTTTEARKRLLHTLQNPIEKHLIGLISRETLTRQLTFANALSTFRNVKKTGLKSRMPIFSEYDDVLLSIYRELSMRPENVFEAGLFRNTAEEQHRRIWDGKEVLYVTGSIDTSRSHGIDVHQMFDNAKSLEIIETVTEQALSKHYEQILDTITSYPGVAVKMILLSQGMAGTVLAYDLAKSGFHAIDLGQPFVHYLRRRHNH